MTSLLKTSSLLLAFLCATATALADYRVLTQFKVGGTGGFDLLCVDSAARRLYLYSCLCSDEHESSCAQKR